LTVPNSAAQQCADALTAAGIKGILNFTSIQLEVPAGVTVQNVAIAQSLAVLSHAITNTQD
jgi:redox-sensing transcriptional repressor